MYAKQSTLSDLVTLLVLRLLFVSFKTITNPPSIIFVEKKIKRHLFVKLVPFDSFHPRQVRKRQYQRRTIVVLSCSKDLERGKKKKN